MILIFLGRLGIGFRIFVHKALGSTTVMPEMRKSGSETLTQFQYVELKDSLVRSNHKDKETKILPDI